MTDTPAIGRYRSGVPVYEYRPQPDELPITVLRLGSHGPPHGTPHIHDFPMVQVCALGNRHEARLVTPGAIVDPRETPTADDASAVLFDPLVLGLDHAGPRHPLIAAFRHTDPNGISRLPLTTQDAGRWRASIDAIESEIGRTGIGYAEAVTARLILLLVEVARAAPAPAAGDALIEAVVDVIDARFAETLTLADVAAEVGLSPGYLTTLMRQRTGRTVVDLLTERRMAAARRLLATTGEPVAAVARRCGYPDPAYFSRMFRRNHRMSAREWRARTGLR
ncbi:AraC family transcriptional regulator [Tsukamurella sp. 8F]|uniref:helix-turn-helix transcriptional regulator n=1 Tax=unclassified Tsukamurella TaxID=2633480 RepID=UPI0023B8B00A|nr:MULTISPECIES: AraC family transcriptional regulator [unclassified Tsukamurella]MDF0528353.1 AraC family transcriptional regulator [Tsukamurella sp. 8J]MDF0586178.1 AraC family transcriptional regulator [Tsukamurella sp. 8F]